MKSRIRLLALATTLVVAISPAFAQSGPEQNKPKVSVQFAEAMKMAPDIEIPGTVVSRNDAQIAAEVAGRVDWVADEGAILQVGDVIARLDDREIGRAHV